MLSWPACAGAWPRQPRYVSDMGLKLFVDDIRRAPEGWHCARTVTEAIRILATQTVDEVSLDHDIAHAVPGSLVTAYATCPEDYSSVAHYLAAMTVDERPKSVRLHTANPHGVHAMDRILRDAGFTEVRIAMHGTLPEDGSYEENGQVD